MKVIASLICFVVILFLAMQLGWVALFIVPLAVLFVVLSFAPYWTTKTERSFGAD